MQHRKTLLGLLLAALLVAAAAFLLPAQPGQTPSPTTVTVHMDDAEAPSVHADEARKAGETGPDTQAAEPTLPEDGSYTARDDVALYLHLYGHLPDNFITKADARALGWPGGGLEEYAPGKCIGGDEFGNYEGTLPDVPGLVYHECDIDTLGADSRGAKRIVYSDDGNVYYTDDHYGTFTLLHGEDVP